jgi:hypothetical protein
VKKAVSIPGETERILQKLKLAHLALSQVE